MILEPKGKRIVIQTRTGNSINCEPSRLPMSPQETERCQREFEEQIKPKLPFRLEIQERRGPTLDYNCHGLTFVLRRAWLEENSSIEMVLTDDGYREIRTDQVLPGDIVIYRDNSGHIEHSGVVVWVDGQGDLRVPWIVSKWGRGGEYIHRYNNSPYSGTPSFMREHLDDNRTPDPTDRGRTRTR
jgi:hypothetical protein